MIFFKGTSYWTIVVLNTMRIPVYFGIHREYLERIG